MVKICQLTVAICNQHRLGSTKNETQLPASEFYLKLLENECYTYAKISILKFGQFLFRGRCVSKACVFFREFRTSKETSENSPLRRSAMSIETHLSKQPHSVGVLYVLYPFQFRRNGMFIETRSSTKLSPIGAKCLSPKNCPNYCINKGKESNTL